MVANTDALIVLPGGPGTWDELWEMACARHLKLNQLPIVCINVDGYYEPFREILDRAYADRLIHLPPQDIVRFASGAEDAVRFVEGREMVRTMATSAKDYDDWKKNKHYIADVAHLHWHALALTFVTGALAGVAIAAAAAKSRAGRGL